MRKLAGLLLMTPFFAGLSYIAYLLCNASIVLFWLIASLISLVLLAMGISLFEN